MFVVDHVEMLSILMPFLDIVTMKRVAKGENLITELVGLLQLYYSMPYGFVKMDLQKH